MTSFMEFMIYVRTLTHPMAFPFQEEMHLVLQYADGGDLRSMVAKKGPFPENTAVFYSSCVLLGIEHLHLHNIAHR